MQAIYTPVVTGSDPQIHLTDPADSAANGMTLCNRRFSAPMNDHAARPTCSMCQYIARNPAWVEPTQRRRDRGDYDGGFGDANCPADY